MKPATLSENDKIPFKILTIIFLFSFLLRLLVIILYPNMPISTDAINDYDPIATNILAGNGFVVSQGQPDFIRGPGYPIFLSAIYSIFGRNFIAVRLVQSVLDSITVILTISIGSILFKSWNRAYIAGIILAIYPLMIYSSNLVAVEVIFCFIFILSVFIFIKAVRTEKTILYFTSGIVLAFATMVRSTPLLFPVIIAIWLAFGGSSKKKYIYYFMLYCCGFLVTLAPWTIRNYRVFHEFILTVANGGYNFYAGSPTRYMVPFTEPIQVEEQGIKSYVYEDQENVKIISPRQFDAHMWHLGWENYKNAWDQNPLEVVKLLFYKAARFWFATDLGQYQKMNLIVQIPFLLLAIIGLIFIITTHGYSKEIWLIVMSITYFWVIFIIMFPLARYTVPILPFLAILVSGLVKRKIYI